MIDLCPHGRPTSVPLSAMVRGINPCDDCYDEEWARVRTFTIVGVSIFLIIVAVCSLPLLGAFW